MKAMEELGNRLNDLLASNDISQRKLALDLGISNVTISRIVRGQGNVMLETLHSPKLYGVRIVNIECRMTGCLAKYGRARI